MNKEECIKCLTILRTTYQSFATKMTARDAESLVNTWLMCFKDEPYEVVSVALYDLIQTKKDFAPDIATVKERISELQRAALGTPDDVDLWNRLVKAVSNSAYCCKEEFEQLPPILKKIAGSARTLFDWSQMESDIFNSVIKGQFNKTIKPLQAREETENKLALNPKLKQMLRTFGTNASIQEPDGIYAPDEINTRRNQLLDAIEAMPKGEQYEIQ